MSCGFYSINETMKINTFVKAVRVHPTLSNTIEPLQSRFSQHDSVPRNPNAKPKRYKYPPFYDPYGPKPPSSAKVVELAERIAALGPEERRQTGPMLKEGLGLPNTQVISTEGMELGSQGGAAAGAGKVEEKKVFDVKLEKFDAPAEIKVIKEVRAFTNLGLKEAKDLVEKVPVVIKQGITKEEANDIIEKIKAAGGVAVME